VLENRVRSLVILGAAMMIGAWLPATARAFPGPAGEADFGGVRNVLAGGQGATVNTLGLAAFQASNAPPPRFTDQNGLYNRLVALAPDVTAANLGETFKPAPFGIAPGQLASSESPRPGVIIQRDRAYGVAHVYGQTRPDVEFGAGYATAEDRLFLMDVLRHTARARLTELIGPGTGDATVRMDAAQLKLADYSEAELQQQLDYAGRAYGPEGQQVVRDAVDYSTGVNAYIAAARLDPSKLPGEYAALGQTPADWRPTDSVAVAGLINEQQGSGGGAEDRVAAVLDAARRRFGTQEGLRVFSDLRERDDPQAPVTTSRRFPFDAPGPVNPAAVAAPDRGSVRPRDPLVGTGAGASASRRRPLGPARRPGSGAPAATPGWLERLQQRGVRLTHSDSNALLVTAAHSRSGHPLAVMGPQVDYYSPQILLELDLHGGGIDAEGAAFPGLSEYVLLGHGRDYAWSATSSNSDNSDLFAERLCNVDATHPTLSSDHYLYQGHCIPFLMRDQVLRTTANPTSPGEAPRTIVLRVQRSVHGPVQATATVAGAPVALALARATYFHEADAAISFKRLNENAVTDAASFQSTMALINSTFNWFYADERDIAYQLSGWYPRRARGANPDLPTWGSGAYDWQGFDPATYTERHLTADELPKDTNPPSGYLVSWNNKPAAEWRAADDHFSYGSVHRSQLLERRVRAALGRGSMDLPSLVGIMGDAGTADLRGSEDYPLLREVLGAEAGAATPGVAPLLSSLDGWVARGAHRRDRAGSGFYEDGPAVALMDAWWPRLVQGMFEPALGPDLLRSVQALLPLDDPPGPGGNAYEQAWYSYVATDLRDLLAATPGAAGRPSPPHGHQPRHSARRQRLRGHGSKRHRARHYRHHRLRAPATGNDSGPSRPGAYSRIYCGGATLPGCRAVLLTTLEQAAAELVGRYGPDMSRWRVPATCASGQTPPACDQIEFTAAGAISQPPIPWQNRGTFQQAVEIAGHRPR